MASMGEGNKIERRLIMMAKSTQRASYAKFTPEHLEEFARLLKSGRVPLERTTISDNIVTGLRAVVYKTGRIAFHASYWLGKKRPFMIIGSFNKGEPDYMSIEDAREVTKAIKALGDKGIDVQQAWQMCLISELKEKGANWRGFK